MKRRTFIKTAAAAAVALLLAAQAFSAERAQEILRVAGIKRIGDR